MKIVLFVNRDLAANIAYNLLKSELLEHEVRIYYSDTVGNPKDKPFQLVKLEYFEREFVFNELSEFVEENKIVHTFEFLDDRFKSFPLEACANVNSSDFVKEIRSFSPDLFISIRFGKIFKEEIIRIPKYGLLNLHSAILPFYRGIMGTLHAIKEGNRNIGCTLHTIPDAGIDTGEIIEIAELDVNREKSLFWNIVQLYPRGVALIVRALKGMDSKGLFISQKQNAHEGNYFSVPTEDDFTQIERLGMKVISATDYLNVLTTFVLKGLSESERERLKICIERTRLIDN
ncbi:MAG: formyl transferase [Cyclobacteriaceae bacterium]